MVVTDKQFHIEDFAIEKMDLMIQRVTKRKLDAIIMCDGDEGFGKTGWSIIMGYYFSQKTGRKFNLDNIFFDPNEFMDKINSSKEQILIWDEAALGGLASGWANKIQQVLIQTMMTCRFRKHIIIFNCPKFYRLNKYFVSERAIGLFHVYSRDKLHAGRLCFYKGGWLENMIDYTHRNRQKPYKKFARKRLRGSFVDAFKLDIIDEDEYEKKKTRYTQKMLQQIKNNKDSKEQAELDKLKFKISKLDIIKQEDLAAALGISSRTIRNWKKLCETKPIVATA